MKPIYPEILTADNTLTITDNGDGTISIDPNQEFLIQDVKINTSNITNRTFTINPSTTYHLRFSLNGEPINNYIPQPLSFYLVDVNDTNYNPNGVAETDTQFDTKYDDMLVVKIESDANNVITITSLKNKRKLYSEGTVVIFAIDTPYQDDTVPDDITNGIYIMLNWSRKGKAYLSALNDGFSINESGSRLYEFNFGTVFKSRYKVLCFYQRTDNANDGIHIKYVSEA